MNRPEIQLERPVVFDCGGHQLMGMLHPAAFPASRAVVLVVGGPQYRIGSHRQFVFLARALASAGWPVLRFDYRGMGDSEGERRDFEDVSDDIRAAIDTTFASLKGLSDCVLWGLCDAASASAFYGATDDRVAGMVLVNPWVRTESGEARTRLRHYYTGRFRDREFWRKLLRLRWNPLRTLADMGRFARRARATESTVQQAGRNLPLPRRMLGGLQAFDGRVLLILSGRDLTAREFEDTVAGSPDWREWMGRKSLEVQRLDEADHTFSRPQWRDRVAEWTGEWLRSW